ncbi:MAG: hypothetical protein L0K73_05725 [Corynebacterium variabile]|uniref:hypothetical protein n=1 Tax=Corynebacterium variabile TaxID=1727 RepID=UPI0026489FCC|nr:hypothetical protein [Corynebacterium variabile]MDN6536294.1 hypothetical protein [Corynebacterium variabile]
MSITRTPTSTRTPAIPSAVFPQPGIPSSSLSSEDDPSSLSVASRAASPPVSRVKV